MIFTFCSPSPTAQKIFSTRYLPILPIRFSPQIVISCIKCCKPRPEASYNPPLSIYYFINSLLLFTCMLYAYFWKMIEKVMCVTENPKISVNTLRIYGWDVITSQYYTRVVCLISPPKRIAFLVHLHAFMVNFINMMCVRFWHLSLKLTLPLSGKIQYFNMVCTYSTSVQPKKKIL